MITILHKYKQALLYGLSLAALLFVLHILEFRLLIISHSFEVYITCIAVVFTALGIWLSLQLVKPKVEIQIQTVEVEKYVYIKEEAAANDEQVNETERAKLGLSNRETEVLQLMADGLSNQEIADQLFVSLNTVKTHSAKLFEKMDVKRRTQAIEKANRLKII